MNTTNVSFPENDTLAKVLSTPVRWPGAVMIVYSLACIVAYALCLMTILTNKDTAKSPSYRIIVHIGISDIGQLFLNGIVGGVFSLCQTDFNFYLNKVIGGVMNSIWVVCATLADLLAWNRLCHTYSPPLAERIFAMKNTRIMLAACWLYGLAWVIAFMFPNLDLLYDPAEHNWNYGPHPSAQIFSTCELAQDIFHCASMAMCYVAIVFKLVKAANQISNSTLNRDKKERLVLLQSMWLCVTTSTAISLFFYNTAIIPNHWAMFFATMVWLTLAGSNAFIYLIFNKNIRTQVKNMLPWGKKASQKVGPSDVSQTRHTNANTIAAINVASKPLAHAKTARSIVIVSG